MKKNQISVLFIVLFLLISLCPSVGMLVFGESKALANEALTKPPQLRGKDGSFNVSLLTDTTNYIADHFAFRNSLVNAWSELNAAVFRTSAEEQVVLGTDGWLYYSSTLDDYMGRGLDSAELGVITRNLSLMQEYAESNGADFRFTIAPNKNSLYPEHMPGFIPAAHESANAALLLPLFGRFSIHYTDLFTPLAQRNETLYYKTDSHWTERGAALAADTLLEGLGKESNYFGGIFVPSAPHRGDLYEMLFPTGGKTEAAESFSGFSFTRDGDPTDGNALTINTLEETQAGTLLCWRDSFGISLYPYLAESFHDAHFYRETNYDLTRIGELGADAVVIELVERNLDWLITYVPVYPAPEREIDLSAAKRAESSVSVTVRADSRHALVHVSGELPAGITPDTVCVGAGDRLYEACLTGRDGKWSCHAYLPENAQADTLCVLVQGGWTVYPIK